MRAKEHVAQAEALLAEAGEARQFGSWSEAEWLVKRAQVHALLAIATDKSVQAVKTVGP